MTCLPAGTVIVVPQDLISVVANPTKRSFRMKKLLLTLGCLANLIAGSQVQAQVIDYQVQVENNTAVPYAIINSFSILGGKPYSAVYAGPFTFKFSDENRPTSSYPDSFDTYCIDLFEEINPPTAVVLGTPAQFSSVSPPLSSSPGWVAQDGPNKAAYLYHEFNGWVHEPAVTADKSTRGGALQLAIWSILYGERKTGSDGTPYYDHSAVFNYTHTSAIDAAITEIIGLSEAANWGRLSDGSFPSQYDSTWWKLRTQAGVSLQNVIGPPVPEPAETALIGLGFIVCCLFAQSWHTRPKAISAKIS
jgi:hypothetical protein